jgi:glycerophosphoryl diester phosphodiesterase
MWLAWVACGTSTGPPGVEAAAGGAGYWPADSRTAVRGAIALPLRAVELDVALSEDRVPVLHDGPWLEPSRCTLASGEPLPERVQVRYRTASELVNGYRCGGLPDPAHPNALLVEDSLMPLSELVAELPSTGIDRVRLDVWFEAGLTPPAEVVAHNVLEVWTSKDLPQVLSVSSNDPELLWAFDEEAHRLGRDLSLAWVLPAEPAAEALVKQELDRWANGLDYARLAEAAGADTLWLAPDLADPAAIRQARDQGVQIGVGPVDDPQELRYWSRPGVVDLLSTNYPGDLP